MAEMVWNREAGKKRRNAVVRVEERPEPQRENAVVTIVESRAVADREAKRVHDESVEVAEEIPVDFASQSWRETIKARLEMEGYSFNELGNAIGVSPSVVMRFVKGQHDLGGRFSHTGVSRIHASGARERGANQSGRGLIGRLRHDY
jgi:trimethylamine:corrinoid methyltransferase-like protein